MHVALSVHRTITHLACRSMLLRVDPCIGCCRRYPGRLDDADYDNTNYLPPESMNADQMYNWFGEHPAS
jgi:hypothetical protein